MNKNGKWLTVVIVTSDRLEQFRHCLSSAKTSAQNVPDKLIEIRVVLNKASREIKKFCQQEVQAENIFSVDKKMFPGAARNIGLKSITSEWIYFIDDDASIEADFFAKALQHMQKKDIFFVGGPNLTPPGSSKFAQATENVLANPLVTWSVSKRYIAKQGLVEEGHEPKMILCNFFVRSEVCQMFQEAQVFDSKLMGGEESHLIAQLASLGKSGLFVSDLYVWHSRRNSVKELFIQMIKYGEGRGILIKRFSEYQVFHLIPIVLLAIGLIFTVSGFAIFVLGSYLLLLFAAFIKSLSSQTRVYAWAVLALSPIIHIGYSVGVIKGLLSHCDNCESR